MADNDAMNKLKGAGQNVLKALGERAMESVTGGVGGLTDKLEDVAGGGPIGKAAAKGGEAMAKGESPIKGALKGAASGVKDKITGGGGGGSNPKATKAMNIIEEIDVGVPITVAYNQWTEFGSFPSFMKKVKNVDAQEDEKLTFKAQVFWSHRTWEATILEQIPDERIVWKSKGEKGHVDGAVTFHELGPNLTRILVVLEYYPQGFMERTGNIWRAAGRRARLEIKHFRRHVMTRTILNPDEVEGWRGIIEDGEVVKSHEEVVEEEEQQRREAEEAEGSDYDEYDEGDESEGESEDDEGEYEDEDYAEEGEPEEGEPEEDEPEDAYEDEAEPEEGEEEGEPEEGEPEDAYEDEAEDEAEPEEAEEPAEGDEDYAEDGYEEEAEPEEPEDEYEEEEEEEPPRRRRRAS
jgi:uncharacterized membrane protein